MSNTLEIEGSIKLINDTQTFNSGFEKREFVIICGDKYPQDIKMEVYKDKCADLDNLKPGQNVKVSFNIRGNEYNGNHYVNLHAWRIESSAVTESAPAPAPAATQQASASHDEEYGDIPF